MMGNAPLLISKKQCLVEPAAVRRPPLGVAALRIFSLLRGVKARCDQFDRIRLF